MLNTLHSSHAEVVIDLLRHMRRLEKEQPDRSPTAGEVEESDIFPDEKEVLLLRRRAALYARLRENWQPVKDLPPCLQQCQLLREVAYLRAGSYIITDPLAEAGQAELSLEQAEEYGRRALEIAEELGDLAEVSETCYVLSQYRKLATDYPKAMDYARQSLAVAGQIGNLRLQADAYGIQEELLTLMGAGIAEFVQCKQRQIELIRKQGEVAKLAAFRSYLAKLLILSGELDAAARELEEAWRLVPAVCGDRESLVIRYFHYSNQAFLHYKKGNLEAAMESQQQAVLLNAESAVCREDFLWDSMARKLWENSDPLGDTSRHDWQLGLCCVEAGIDSPDELAAILMRNPHGKYQRDGRRDYLETTVMKLRESGY